MQHQIPTDALGPRGRAMAEAIEACVHCGFCLPACPTYRVLGQEMDSPRGRIMLMKEALEGTIGVEETQPYVDRCLGCMACVTACPSGVEYGHLLAPFRDHARRHTRRSAGERLRRALVLAVLPHPRRLRWALRLGRLAVPFRGLLPASLRGMLELVPARLPRAERSAELYPAQGERRARVALLEGCAQRVLAPEIHRATVAVLQRCGVEVAVPRGQGCCGSLAWHTGEAEAAQIHARRNLAVFPEDVDAIVTNAAGCGSGMKEYGLLFRGEREQAAAERLAARVEDAASFLDRLGWEPPTGLEQPTLVAYHDACHLQHAQRERSAARRLLASIPNLRLVEIPQPEICCGSAGTYNLDHPEIAARLGVQKADNVLKTGAEVVATGNVGCIVQIRNHLRDRPGAPAVRHTFEILAEALASTSQTARALLP